LSLGAKARVKSLLLFGPSRSENGQVFQIRGQLELMEK